MPRLPQPGTSQLRGMWRPVSQKYVAWSHHSLDDWRFWKSPKTSFSWKRDFWWAAFYFFLRYIFTPPFQGVLYDLVDGSLVSDCPLPCKTTLTQAKHLYQHTLTSTQKDITFSSKVKVTRTDLVKPALSIFLSEVGLKRRKLSLIKFNFRLVGRWVSGWVLGWFKCFSSQWIVFWWCHVTARACRNRFLPFYFNIMLAPHNSLIGLEQDQKFLKYAFILFPPDPSQSSTATTTRPPSAVRQTFTQDRQTRCSSTIYHNEQ